ncbi:MULTISPECIES: Ig-like domain-containing protein [Pseudoalteromonas]|uniref:Ig-like domain-containing protein n=3 Tax=Pseudoalteromonas TaxID=53246 RepID=UPI0002C8FE83|nr:MULTISPECIES: Ig-like domain-containing protein [Pseudoalteromonas]ENO00741.1 hemagglutinin/hemolysin-like protein [Pseudoalteromonas agarivorans S816]MDI3244562.1 Ig-like domain-containing protein [Pseudoalteromonas agarivorans]TMS74516.1 tandem-95 repeat protein [Pseudoalteromonas sp. S1941]TMS77257.1 tandem-95 repeat protein [Pseudoalteromonas sp. S1690]TMS84734.1 tandem-95 repeat protein [Pseudoalteromonas sp. S981]
MTAKNLFLLGSMVFLLSACGGSDETAQQDSEQLPVEQVTPTPSATPINLTGITGDSVVTKTQVSGAVASSRGVVGTTVANSQATITLSQINEVIQGNITFLLSVSDPDGISAVNLVLPSVNKSLALCTQACGTDFEQSVIGLSPYFYGVDPGDLRLEIWITDNLNNQALADAVTANWQPYQIEGTTAQRDGQTINLAWKENENLNRYNIYLATEAGITTSNINTLENGQQFLSVSGSSFSVDNLLADKSYQVLITGVDGSGESGFAELINVAPQGGELNFAPKAVNDQFLVNEDQALQGNVLTNDTDEYQGELYINTTPLVTPQHGSISLSESGDFTYTPRANFNGIDAFSYQVINELGMTDTGIVEITINAVNDAPIALNNTYNISADGTLLVGAPGLLNNDSDIDQDLLTLDTTPVSLPSKGTLTLVADGSFEYVGSANMQGTDSFQYRIFDAQGAEAIASVTINALDQNSPPTAANDSYSVDEDTTLVVDASQGLLANDTDPNNDTFIIDDTYLISPAHGQLQLATDGSFSYIPDSNYYGIDEFQYQVIDTFGATATATATLTINSMPDTPNAQNDEYQFQYNQTLVISAENGLLKNDVNIEPGNLTVNTTPVVNVQSGTLALNVDGSFSYQPDSDALDVDSFTYSVSNEQGLTSTAQVVLSKTGSNSPAEANDDEYTLLEDSPATMLNVLENDTDANGDTLTLTNVTNTIGSARIVNNRIEYTPEPNYFGEVTLNYTISDGIADGTPAQSSAMATLIIIPVNDAPIAVADSAAMQEDASPILVDVLANDTDIDSDNLTITSVGTEFGSASIVDNKIQYSSAPNTHGVAIVSYSVSDNNGAEATANLQVTISPVNDAPIANADSITITEDATATLINVLSNDTDIDGDTLTLSSASSDIGSVSIVNSQIQYTPAENDNGTATVSYTITDGTQSASGILTVTITSVNDTPVANPDTATILEDAAPTSINVIANDTDVDSDPLAISTASASTGSVSVSGSNLVYTPEANFNGQAVVNYTLTDGTTTAAGVLTVTVTAVNDAPVANPDTATILEDAAATNINVLGNDTDEENDALSISALTTTSGAVTSTGNDVIFTSEANFNGQVTVNYTLSDGTDTAMGVLTITVTPVNDAPIANPDSATILEDAVTTNINVLSNDTDPENDSLTISEASTNTGSVSVAGSNLAYTPEADFNGQAVINYTLSDGTDTASGVLNITVTPVNDSPVANPDTATINEDSSTTVNVVANDTDTEGDSLTITTVSADSGSATIVANQIQYTPQADYNGTAVVTYTVSDGEAATSATLNITINSVNDAPVASPDTATILEDAAATNINVLGNDTDVENDTLSISAVTATSGTVTSSAGDVIYTPEANFSGQASVTYTLSDGTDTTNGVLTITVTPVNDAPVANPDTATILEDAAATNINVLGNDTDVENDTLSISTVTATSGTVTSSADDVIYTPEANFSGQVTINYTLSDGTDTANGVLTITVTPVNDAPVANPDTTTILEDASATSINVLSNDTDEENDTLSITSVNADVGAISSSGANVVYTPEANFNGQVIVNYILSDGTDTAAGTLTINVTPVNDAPVAQPDTATINEDAPETTIDVISNDTDADATDTLALTAVTADIGTASVENNEIKYTPALNNESTATLTYTLSDGTDEVQGNLTITIVAINDAPTAVNQTFAIGENSTDGETIGTITASDIENDTLTFSLSGGETSLFNIDSNSGLLTVNGNSAFNFETATQHTVNIDITDNGSPNETTTITINVNITDEEDPLIPVEDDTFGRAISEQLDLSSVFSNGEFNDSIELNTNLYFVGYNNNTDTDIVVVSYTNTGDLNTAFNSSGFKTIDFGEDETGTAIISGNGELFIGYSSFNGSETEACLLKMSAAGVISTNSGDANSGTKCTTLASESVINDLEFTDNKIQGVGYSVNGSDKDSLFLKFDVSTLAYESGSPGIVDVSGQNLDDESHAIKNFGNSDLLVVGSSIGEEGDLDATIRYLIPDGNNNGSFNSGDALILDLSDEEGDDELLAVGGVDAANFNAFLGGYITRSSGEKEAVMISIDNNGNIDENIGDEGIAVYNIDENSGSANGGAQITGVQYAPMSNQIILSGTTGVEASGDTQNEQLFSARVSISDGALDTSYGNAGINIVSNVISHQSANASTIDENDTLWLSGRFNDSSNEPFVTSITSDANLNTDFAINGYTSINDLSVSSDDLSMNVLQLQNGVQANKFLSASIAQLNTNNKLVLTRYSSAGIIDTSFSLDGSKALNINVAFKTITLKELSDGSIIIAGTLINGLNEEGFIAKVDQDGYLDESFANEGIYTTVDILNININFADVAVDSSGYIVAVGSSTNALSVTRSFATMLKSDGNLENSFATSGAYYGSVNEFFETLYIDTNKDIYIAGKQVSGSDSQLIMLKIDDDANALFSYTDSRSSTDISNRAAKILADSAANLYLVANEGTTPNQAVIIKLQPDGTEDTSFATSGVGQYQLASSSDTKVTDAVIDTTGNIILSGMSDSKGMIARILANGTIDTLFGENTLGYYQANQCDGTHQFTSMLLQTDTQVVLSSTCFDNASNNVSLSKFNFYPDRVKP